MERTVWAASSPAMGRALASVKRAAGFVGAAFLGFTMCFEERAGLGCSAGLGGVATLKGAAAAFSTSIRLDGAAAAF